MNWKYIKPLKSEQNINSFEKIVNYKFPKEFKDLVKQYNGGRPEFAIFDTDKILERHFKCLLSFNYEDKETIWDFYECLQGEIKNKYIPFAIDDAGNLICFDRSDNIIFINHDNMMIEIIAKSFNNFIEKLYKITDTF